MKLRTIKVIIILFILIMIGYLVLDYYAGKMFYGLHQTGLKKYVPNFQTLSFS